MARPYRLQGEGLLYHITSRGDDRKKVFISKTDYQKFLEYIQKSKEKFKFYLYAYCLMGNHYHLLLETTQANISRVMQHINTSYTVYYNVKRKRCGHVFQGRYKSIVVEADSYLLELTRYIHLNPVRAKIAGSPEKYPWSSYHEYIKKTNKGIVDKSQLKRYFKLSDDKYKKFVLEGMDKPLNPFSKLYAGFILGKEKFIKDTLAILKDQVESEEFAHKKTIYGIMPDEVIRKVSEYYKKDSDILRGAKKKPLLAKKIAVYLLKQRTALTNREIGDMFGLSHSGVSWIAKNVERLIFENSAVKRDVELLNSHLEV